MCLQNTWYSTRKTNYSAILTYLPNAEKEFIKIRQDNQGKKALPGCACLQNKHTLKTFLEFGSLVILTNNDISRVMLLFNTREQRNI